MPSPRPPLRRSPVRPIREQWSLIRRMVRGAAALPWNRLEMKLIESGRASPPARAQLPDFLGIGTPQSGTTWLFDKLIRHPDVFVPERKEMAFFYWERTEVHKRLLGLREYASCYAEAGTRLKGDLTPNYSVLSPDRIRYVARLMPDAKLILVIRDPVQRTWSATRRVLPRYIGGPTDDPGRIIGLLERESWIHAFSNYPTIVDNWTDVFPVDALLTLEFDAIQRRPADVLRRTFAHLGLEADVDLEAFDLEGRVNTNPEMEIPPDVEEYLRRKYAPVLSEMERRGMMEHR